MITRRSAAQLLAGTAAVSAFRGRAFATPEKTIQIGIDFSLTGGDAASAQRMRDGALMAIDEANAKGIVKGYKLVPMVLDDATATAGQYAQVRRRQDGGGCGRPADERRRQGDGADPEHGRPGDHHAVFHQPGPHRP